MVAQRAYQFRPIQLKCPDTPETVSVVSVGPRAHRKNQIKTIPEMRPVPCGRELCPSSSALAAYIYRGIVSLVSLGGILHNVLAICCKQAVPGFASGLFFPARSVSLSGYQTGIARNGVNVDDVRE